MLADKLLEGYGGFYTSAMESEITDPIAYMNDVCIEAITALQEAAQQYYIGDIIGQSQVIMEGYTDEVLTESVGSKAKQLWEAFKKKVKEIIGKIVSRFKQFIAWIKSKFSKKKDTGKELIDEIKSFDPHNPSTHQNTDSSQYDKATKRIDEAREKMEQSRSQKDETHNKDRGHAISKDMNDRAEKIQQATNKIVELRNGKAQTSPKEKPSQIVLALPGGQSNVLALPMKSIDEIPIPSLKGLDDLLKDIGYLGETTRNIADAMTDLLDMFIYDLKNNGWDEIASDENDVGDLSPDANKKINKRSFDEYFTDYNNKPKRFQNMSPGGTMTKINKDFIDIISSHDITHINADTLVKMLDMKETAIAGREFNIAHLEARVRSLEKYEKLIASTNPPTDNAYVNRVVTLMSTQISNGISAANFELSVWRKSLEIMDKKYQILKSAWQNYKEQVKGLQS